MKTFTAMASLIASLALSTGAQATAIYDYSYTFQSGDIVNGSFSGNASGNLLTDLSGITVLFNGTALTGSGAMYASAVDVSTNSLTTAAVASFDGTANNFIFTDTMITDWSDPWAAMFSIGPSEIGDYTAFVLTTGWNVVVYDNPSVPTRWTVAERSTVPEPSTMALLALGLAGFGLTSRGKSKSRAI